jgi:hypothetical protein
MKRTLLSLFLALLFAGVVYAQYTTVSGTAVDLAGTPFVYGNYTISLINTSGQQATLNGNSFQQIYSGTLTATGALPSGLVLPSNTSITPSGTQWSFNICANAKQLTGVYPTPPVPCFTTNETITGTTQNLDLIGNVVIPLATDSDNTTSLTITAPLLSNAVITQITNSSGVSTMTCSIPGCGLSAGEQFTLGEGFANSTGCQGPWVVSSVNGNTASFTSTTCSATGTYYGQIGPSSTTSVYLTSANANKGDGLAIQEGYDGEASLLDYHGGKAVSVLDLNSTGQWYLSDIQDGTALGVGADRLICLGELPTDMNGNCMGTGIDFSSGRGKGVFAVVRGVTTQGTGVATHLPDYVATNVSANLGAPGYQVNGGNGAINLVTLGTSGFPSAGDYRITPYFNCGTSTPNGTLRIYIFYFDATTGTIANTYVSAPCSTGLDGTYQQVQPLMIPAYVNPSGPSTGYIQVYFYQSNGAGFLYNIRLVIESL